MAVPGVVMVWSSGGPRLETHRIPPDASGLVLGRTLADSTDDRISREHARIRIDRGELVITDLASRNGTFVAGYVLPNNAPVKLVTPAIVRTGMTMFAVVADVIPYEQVSLSRRGELVVGGSLAPACRAVDQAAIEAEHVTLVGPKSVTRVLARGYAAAAEGGVAIYDQATTTSLELALHDVSTVRTILLELVSPLAERDVALVGEWLETDVRFVTTMPTRIELAPAIASRLTQRVIEIPKNRFDELPTTLHEIVKATQPAATIHADVIEQALVAAPRMIEDIVLEHFRNSVEAWRDQGRPMLRTEDLAEDGPPGNWCLHGDLLRR